MATIKKREGKTGTSYLIRSSCGYDTSGRQVMRSMTWKPKPGMTEKQIEKELNRQAVLFDEKCSAQGVGNGNIKFQAFAEQWFKEYAEPNPPGLWHGFTSWRSGPIRPSDIFA